MNYLCVIFITVLLVGIACGQDYSGHNDHHKDYPHHHPKYKFEYGVKDPKTGDHKDQWETRDGDKVKGSYSLIEPDGTKRVVEYEADDKNGFNAEVKKIGHAHHPEQHKHYDHHHKEHHTDIFTAFSGNGDHGFGSNGYADGAYTNYGYANGDTSSYLF